MAVAATPISTVHEQFLPISSGGMTLPAPWETLDSSAEVTLQRVQNLSTSALQVDTGTQMSSITLAPGDTLIAWADDAARAILRIPNCGRQFTTTKRCHVGMGIKQLHPSAPAFITPATGDLLLFAGALRGSCSSGAVATVRASIAGTTPVGLPNLASAQAIVTQPGGDAVGNGGAAIAGLVTVAEPFQVGVGGGYTGGCGAAALNSRVSMMLICESVPLDVAPRLDAPVTVHFNESLNGVFADPGIEASFFQMVDLPVGSRYALGDQLSGLPWYTFTIRDRSRSSGLVNYTGETLLARLARVAPRESLILVAGEDGVPAQLDLRECLRRFLTYYGVPFNPDLPAFFLKAGDEIVAPTVTGFVIQPDQENPESLYSLLERFFGPFRGYTWRADTQDRLVVSQPAWVDTIGLRLTVFRTRDTTTRVPARQQALAPWSTNRRPIVEWQGSVNGHAVSGSHPTPLELGAPITTVNVGGLTMRLQWRSSDDHVFASVWPPPSPDLTVGDVFSVTFVFRPESLPGDVEALALTNDDLGPDEVETTSAESVINQAIVPVRERTFLPAQQIMQAGALVLKSPGGVMPGLFGNTPFGPMDEDLQTPTGFLEIVNGMVQTGTWFWPADSQVVVQPGGNITVAYEVEEWAEQWRASSNPHAPASQVNAFSDTVDLPANGVEVKLFDFQFPRQTTNFAPGAYGARGSVWGRWRAGVEPGIELRVGNSHFVEFGYLVETLGFLGETRYFLWGAIVKLNGTGAAFTNGDLHTYRFGFARGDNGLWEDSADVPALAESQRLYPDRVYRAQELPYTVTPEVGMAIARSIVEESLAPKTVYSLPIVPDRPVGWAARPHHLGRAVSVRAPGLHLDGRLVSIDYPEAHTPPNSSSGVTIEVEVAQPPAGSRAASRAFGRAAYGVSHYQQED